MGSTSWNPPVALPSVPPRPSQLLQPQYCSSARLDELLHAPVLIAAVRKVAPHCEGDLLLPQLLLCDLQGDRNFCGVIPTLDPVHRH